MKELNYKMIISDFDGTLVQKDHEIGEFSKKEIANYIKNGGKFAISTGRMPAGIMPRVEELGLKGIVSCCQGSIIMDIESKQRILDEALSYETTLAIVEKLEEHGMHIHLYGEWEFYSNMDDEALHAYEEAVRAKANLILDKPMSQFVKETKFRSYKIMVMVRPQDNQRYLELFSSWNFNECTLTKSASTLIEFINGKNSKGTAVEFLSKYYNIPLEQVIGVGDQWNDIPMVKTAGLGIAVNNADNALKEEADYVCEYTNNENAIGHIIQKFGYKEN